MKIGLYFGSFNPIHTGHLIIANHIVQHTDIDKIWFVVSPHNPLKKSNTLLNEYDRFHLVEMAIADNPKFRASNIEFSLPRPSYTIDTLTYLNEKFPTEQFVVIMGSDSFKNIGNWKNSDKLLAQYQIIIYQRPKHDVQGDELPDNIILLDAPFIEISATYIRQLIQSGKSIQYLVSDNVRQYIEENGYYKAKKN